MLPPEQFLPHSCSAESLVDEYCAESGGSPDKILIADDANPILGTWTKSGYGERVGQRFLNLYDCKALSESFERNRKGKGDGRRNIPETCTSVLLGATFDICRLSGRGISSGLQRRFIFYAAERHGRFIPCPPSADKSKVDQLVEMLKKLSKVSVACSFSDEANARWELFQRRNRQLLQQEKDEAHLARLNGAPRQVQKVAMLFAASIWAKQGEAAWDGIIDLPTLELAIAHVEHCLATAVRLDTLTERSNITTSADVLLARIRRDFASPDYKRDGYILLTKTNLTAKYAAHTNRAQAWTPDDLYGRFIPDLIARGLAHLHNKEGKKVVYAFSVED